MAKRPLDSGLALTLALLLAACAGGNTGGGSDDDDDDDARPDASTPPDDDVDASVEPPDEPEPPDASTPPKPDAAPPPKADAAPPPPPPPPPGGLGAWTGMDDVKASPSPPMGLSAAHVPQFVVLGWDDNAYSGLEGSAGTGGMSWATSIAKTRQNPDGSPVRFSFYMTSVYIGVWQSESPTFVKKSWRAALTDGHEIGVHTHTHPHGMSYSAAQWESEIQTCIDWLTKPFDPNEPGFSPNDAAGIGASFAQIVGFRTPFLEYGDATLGVVDAKGFRYDCSIEDGWQWEQDGTNYNWPYTLDHGSPGHDVLVGWGSKAPITSHPGLWELPVHPVIVPPELRATMKSRVSWFDEASGKITGFDYNLWVSFKMTKAEFLATLKYTLDQRLAGNRAPLMFGVHTDYYSSKYTAAPASTPEERRQAIEEFLDYALSKQAVRVVPNAKVLEWVRNPTPI